jgi:prepilin-type N-terminal cleavage/methylation domain-containing protein
MGAYPAHVTRGFTLIEVLIAIAIFSVVVLALAGLAFQIARRSTKATDLALHMAMQLAAADHAVAVPFDRLTQLLKPDTVWSGQVRITVRYVIVPLSTVRKDVYVITQTSMPGTHPDTVIIRRGMARDPIPLR